MVMRISLSSANVDAGEAGTFEKVHVETRGDRLKARKRDGTYLLDVQVTAVRKLANRTYEADTEVGLVKFVRAGCGCGK